MKLTKDQRHTAYIIMLDSFETDDIEGCQFFCECMSYLFDWSFSERPIRKYLPELWSKRPKPLYSSTCWFDSRDKDSRIDLLNQCINETA
jgi:hypothetical protein